jgi:hypothetical protein
MLSFFFCKFQEAPTEEPMTFYLKKLGLISYLDNLCQFWIKLTKVQTIPEKKK